MGGITRKLSPAAFVLAFICFFLPFVTFSCRGQEIATFSGLQLATGTTIEKHQVFGASESERVNPEPLAVVALLAVLAGAGVSFIKGKKGTMGSVALAVLGVIVLAALKSKLDGEALRQAHGAVQVNLEVGYYMTLVFLAAAVGWNVYALLGSRATSLPVPHDKADGKSCSQCGARNAAEDVFCGKCGAKFP